MLVYYIRNFFSVYGVYICIVIFSYQCAYFNTFYNAEQSFEKALKVIQNAPILENGKLPSESITLLNEVINNCDTVIEKYPDSKYVDKAYLIKGISYFYKKSYDLAIDNLKGLLDSSSPIYYNKALLWSAYSVLRRGDVQDSDIYLSKISTEGLDKEELYIYYNIKAEIDESVGDMEEAYENYILASNVTSDESRKIYIYRKLIYLSELSKDLESKAKFIELLEPYIDNLTELRNLKIDWIEAKRSIDDFDEIIQEIDNIIEQDEFKSIKAKLLIHKSKAYKNLNKIKSSKDILNEIVLEYSRKDETSEAYYILGGFSLFKDFDLEKTKEYYQKSIEERSRSEYAKKAKALNGKIEEYENLIADFEYFKNNSSIDSSYNDQELDNMDISLPDIKGEVKIDSLIFEIGQILYFDFNQVDSAMIRYQYILDNFPNSSYNNQVSKILEYNLNPNLIFDEIKYLDRDTLLYKRDKAWSLSDLNMQKDYYKSMYNEYKDSIALFNIAYIEDLYLYNKKEAVSVYRKIKEDYLNHPNIDYINERLTAIQSDVANLIKENNFSLRFNDALQLAQNSQLDSARTILENIAISRKSPFYKTINTLIKQIDIYDDLKASYIIKSSDSLIYKMAEIEYFYFYDDVEPKNKFEQIINQFPDSKWWAASAWNLNRNFNANPIYLIDSLDYLLIDTSVIRTDSPIKNLDIKEIRLDSIKLDDILLEFENGV